MAAVWSSTKLLEFDFAGIEAVLLGWFMGSPLYTRLGKLGMHAYVASHKLGRPADLTWPDDQLAAYFKAIKKSPDARDNSAYESCKRVVHGTGYGQTPMGVYLTHPKWFKSLKEAEEIQAVYFSCAPELPEFHRALQRTAHEQGYLGGAATYHYDVEKQRVSGHPYQYQLQLNSVITYERLTLQKAMWRQKRKMPVELINNIWYGIKLGEDAKRAAAYYPQSTARGVLTEASFPLFDPDELLASRCYIGDFYYGDTPLRAPIHDSLLLECPTRKCDRLIENVAYAMQRPVEALPLDPTWGMGDFLTIGVDAKIGNDWGAMEHLALPSWEEIGVAGDVGASPLLDADEDDEDEREEWATEMAG